MKNEINREQVKEQTIARMKNVIRGQAMIVRDNKYQPVEVSNVELEVILNLAEFLDDYDNNLALWHEARDIQRTMGREK